MKNLEFMMQLSQFLLTICNLCIMAAIFKNFLNKPKNETKEQLKEMEERIIALEVCQKDIKQSLYMGNDKFRDQKEINEIILNSIIALIEFNIESCISQQQNPSEELKKAKANLNAFFARK